MALNQFNGTQPTTKPGTMRVKRRFFMRSQSAFIK